MLMGHFPHRTTISVDDLLTQAESVARMYANGAMPAKSAFAWMTDALRRLDTNEAMCRAIQDIFNDAEWLASHTPYGESEDDDE